MKTLSETEFQLLALVLSNELAGREIAQYYRKETGKTISYGTLYTTFRRLKESGFVESRDATDEDGRIRYFRATGVGHKALRETRARFEELAGFGLPAI